MENADLAKGPAETVVGPSVKIQGDLKSEGNIRIEGQVNGKVKTSQSVYVGEGAKIAADMVAGNATVAGEIQGNVKISGNLILLPSARVVGDISCAILRVEDGAQFTGKCAMGGAAATLPEKETHHKGSEKTKHKIEPEPEQ